MIHIAMILYLFHQAQISTMYRPSQSFIRAWS